jgi:DNA-binding MarR family transcriptional regulator
MAAESRLDEIVIPALLRSARGSYGLVIKRRLYAYGFDDMPHNGPYVLGGMANHGMTPETLIRALGISKQAASQLIDVLVVRGYLSRAINPDDRRRMTLELTERGRAAAAAVQDGIQWVDRELAKTLTSEEIHTLRKGLAALSDIREQDEA